MDNLLKPARKPAPLLKYRQCPSCRRKGLYVVHGQYCRCRYCGLYRILLPEQDI